VGRRGICEHEQRKRADEHLDADDNSRDAHSALSFARAFYDVRFVALVAPYAAL
jgi:hypothetical protein